MPISRSLTSIHSVPCENFTPLHTFPGDHLRLTSDNICGRGSFAVWDQFRFGIICGAVQLYNAIADILIGFIFGNL